MLQRGLLLGPLVGAALVSAVLIGWRPGNGAVPPLAGNLTAAASAMITTGQSQTFRIELPDTLPQSASLKLVVAASAYRPSAGGGISYVVRLRVPPGAGGASNEVEVGRFGIFPAQAFTAKAPSDARRFGFAMTRALIELGVVRGPLDVVISAESTQRANAEVAGQGELTIASVAVETVARDP